MLPKRALPSQCSRETDTKFAQSFATTVAAGLAVAKELGITIDAVKFDVSSDFDPTVMTTGRGTADATFQNLVITAEITTDPTPEQFATLRDDTARRCPVSVLFARAGVKITNDWTQVTPS